MEGPLALSGASLLVNFANVCCLTHRFLFSMSTDPESRRDFGPYLEGVGPTFVNEEGDTQMIQSFLMRI